METNQKETVAYESPNIEVIEVAVEAGFALSTVGYSYQEVDENGEAL